MTTRGPLARVSSLTARISALEAERETAIVRTVTAGATWSEIGAAAGALAQAAHKSYRWLRHSTITGEPWHEPPLPR
ncbi:MAG: hypothetical protein M3063_17395 [Actinomycetota bacterium]|nr:hypothetical protein [Actinomycetota bacterium]MDQ6945659.1 hypothetical protein [Actinomycetota bacterium]